jgi:hypothetical protein
MFFLVLLSWVVAGALVGFVASKVVNLRGDDPRLGIGAAVAGAVAGGVIYGVASGTGIATWSLWSVCAAAGGALVGVLGWHAVRSRSISHQRYVPRRSY